MAYLLIDRYNFNRHDNNTYPVESYNNNNNNNSIQFSDNSTIYII